MRHHIWYIFWRYIYKLFWCEQKGAKVWTLVSRWLPRLWGASRITAWWPIWSTSQPKGSTWQLACLLAARTLEIMKHPGMLYSWARFLDRFPRSPSSLWDLWVPFHRGCRCVSVVGTPPFRASICGCTRLGRRSLRHCGGSGSWWRRSWGRCPAECCQPAWQNSPSAVAGLQWFVSEIIGFPKHKMEQDWKW